MIDVSSIYRRQPQGLRQGAALAVALSLALAGCERPLNGAIDLFHGLEGGPIADQRPPPPGVDAPYPNLGTTPARPLAPDVAAEQRIGDTLAAQRDAATAEAARDPLKALPRMAPPPKPPADDPNANKVVVDAAPSPPPPAPPKTAAPAKPPAIGLDAVPALAPALVSAPLPELADAPPPGPNGFGITVPLPPPTPAIVVKPPASTPSGVVVAFTPGSSTLPPSANLRLRRYVMAHRGAQFTVTGRGDGGGKSADLQSRAMELGLKRAAAIAVSLGGSGVAAGNIHIRADAAGTDSIATLN
jgi:outer membrane protein OmpA-like peptidoglycan-associated protein